MSSPTQLRVLHVVSPGRVGGLERVVRALAAGHRQRGHDVSVAALLGAGDDGAPFASPLEEAGVAVHRCKVRTYSIARERGFIRKLCSREQPQIVHTHGYRPDLVDSGVARGLGIPTLSTEHGMSLMGGRTSLYEWLQMRGFRRFDAVVAVSKSIEAALVRSGVEPERIHLVPNAWAGDVAFLDRSAARQRLGLPLEGPVVGWIGRLIRAKGADVLLRALASLPDVPLRSLIIGDGPERSALQRLADSLGLAERVEFTGEILDAAAYLAAFDVLVSSSRSEGTPIVLFEAMAAGVPIVAAAVGGVPDVLGGDGGLLVPPEDPDALAAALRDSLQAPDTGRRCAERAARRLAERYALEPWLDRYEAIYRALIAARSRA